MLPYRNLGLSFHTQARRIPTHKALLIRREGAFGPVLWDEYAHQVTACSAGLIDRDIQPGDRVGVFGENRVEWLFADLAILAVGGIVVAPHSSLTPRQLQFQLADAGVRFLFVSTPTQLEKVRQVRKELPHLEGVVLFEVPPSFVFEADEIAWSEFQARGNQRLADPILRGELQRREAITGPDDPATIMYTSGTTGNPKGVVLTHGNLLSNSTAVLIGDTLGPGDLIFCWLPLSHIYARTVDYYKCIVGGLTLCLAESAETVVRDLAEVQPTHFSSVPRFYEKLLALVASPNPVITAAKLRAVFGKRMRWLGSGGAPLPPAVEQALLDAGLPILPGYGLTESSPVISFNRLDKNRAFTVGPAVADVEIKIADDGEILTRGPHVMRGYWNNPEATAEAIRDEWLYTGDLGTLDEDGFLRITGRKKELLVMSNGRKVVPNQIEGLLVADDYIDQAVVYGEGRNFLTALIVPNWQRLKESPELRERLSAKTDEQCAADPEVYAVLAHSIETRLADVSAYERVKKFIVLPRPFSVAEDELTVSLKLRRNVIHNKHRRELDALYR